MNEYRWDDLTVGLKHSFDATFTSEMVDDFARISGDVNPLHVDPDYAIAAGFPGPVIFGMMTSSLYSRLVGVYIPGKLGVRIEDLVVVTDAGVRLLTSIPKPLRIVD